MSALISKLCLHTFNRHSCVHSVQMMELELMSDVFLSSPGKVVDAGSDNDSVSDNSHISNTKIDVAKFQQTRIGQSSLKL